MISSYSAECDSKGATKLHSALFLQFFCVWLSFYFFTGTGKLQNAFPAGIMKSLGIFLPPHPWSNLEYLREYLSHKQHQTSAGCGPHSTLRKCSFIRESGHLSDPQKILLENHWTLRNTSYVLWWINPGCLPHVHQSQSITSLLSWTGETKCNKRLTGWEKDREIPLTSYYHRQSRLYLRKLVIFITNEVRVV